MVSLFRASASQQLLVVAAFSLGASGATGCRTSCDDAVSSDPVVVDDGHTDATRTKYESVEMEGKWLEFPPSRVFEFKHHLSSEPFAIVPYVSFGPCPNAANAAPGTCDDGGHSTTQAAVAAGDLAPISDITSESFRVHNNTCETFWLRVVAFSADFSAASGSAGAGGASADGDGAGGTQ